ncbi:hypothetical protein HYV58_00005, partial [Candidatus Peregrinibacteria bacterium]|nr:hypothetical protein [Candidatus Peregrinibacteria bacterium]
MARTATAERYSENPITIPFEAQFKQRALGLNERVCIKYRLTDGGPSFEYEPLASTHDPATGMMTATGQLDMPEGAKYVYQYVIRDMTANKDVRDVTVPKSSVAVEANLSAPAGTSPIGDVMAGVKGHLGGVLKTLKSKENVEGVDALIEQIELELDSHGVVSHKPEFVIQLLCEAIAESDAIPKLIKREFAKGRPYPANYQELAVRLDQAGRQYQKSVFLQLKANPAARKSFRMKGDFDRNNPLKNKRRNALFFRVCAEHGDFSFAAPYLAASLKSMEVRNRTDVVGKKERRDLLLQRKALAKKIAMYVRFDKKLSDIPITTKGRVLDAALQAAIIGGGVLTGTVVAPAALFLAKGAFQALSGSSGADV